MVPISLKIQSRLFSLQSVVWNYLHSARLRKWTNKLLLVGTKTKCKAVCLILLWLKQSSRCVRAACLLLWPAVAMAASAVRWPSEPTASAPLCFWSHVFALSLWCFYVSDVVTLNHMYHYPNFCDAKHNEHVITTDKAELEARGLLPVPGQMLKVTR